MTAEIVLVRHATTADTRAGRFSGHEATPLDERGRLQARAIGERLGSTRFDQVLASPVRRAWETAELAGFAAPEAVQALVEWRYGELEGLRTADVRERDPAWTLWADGAPGGETPDAVAERVAPVLARLRAATGPTAVVSHGHVLRVLIVGWLGLPVTEAGALVVDPASISVLGRRHGRPSLVTLNGTSHVPPDGT